MKHSCYSEYAQYSDARERHDRLSSEPSRKEPLWPTLLGLILGLGLILALAFLWYFPMLRQGSQTNREPGIAGPSTYVVNVRENNSCARVIGVDGVDVNGRQGG